jgi:PKD repeat protein
VNNWGSEMISEIPVSYSVNGGVPVTDVVGTPLFPGQKIEFTFSTPITLDVEGAYTISAWTSFPDDTETLNDTSVTVIYKTSLISEFPYVQGFEDDSGNWSKLGDYISWETGSPDGDVIDSPSPFDPDAPTAWMTDLDQGYNNREFSFVVSPCFDFSSLTLPYVAFDAQWDTEEIWDGAQLQYRTDSEGEWSVLGSVGSGENWYTSLCAAFGYDPSWPSGFPEAWVGTVTEWERASHQLHDLAGEAFVQFRFVFIADESVNDFDGFAFDNFLIADPPDNDLELNELLSPVSDTDLGLEEVSVRIINRGILPQSGFLISYAIDGETPVEEMYMGELLPGDSLHFSFALFADLSAYSDYSICTWVSLPTDEDLTNDTLCLDVTNLAFNNFLVYSSLPDDAPWSDNGNASAMQSVFGDGWSLEFYETLDIASVFDSSTCMIYMEGSDKHANEMENFLISNQEVIETWVANGGNLFINAAPTEGDGMDLGFEGTSLHYPWYSSGGVAIDEAHPIFDGPFLPVETLISGSSFGHASLSGLFDTLMSDPFSPEKVVLAEKVWGLGRVVFGGMTTTNFHEPLDAAFNLRANILDYMSECSEDGVYDLSLVSAMSPDTLICGADSSVVSVMIENLSGIAVSDFICSYTLDGGMPVNELFSGSISPFSTQVFSFTETVDLSSTGTYELAVSIDLPLDVNSLNDTLSYSITNNALPDPDLPEEGEFCNQKEVSISLENVTFLWSTGDTTSSILITESGSYNVLVTDTLTGCVGFDTVDLIINYTPEAFFGYTFDLPEVSFSNLSLYADTFEWSFGDGGTSTLENPTYTYSSPGNYVVKLVVTNECGIDQFVDTLTLINNNLTDDQSKPGFRIYPNPGKEPFYIEWMDWPEGNASLWVKDVSGRVVYTDVFPLIDSGNRKLVTLGLSPGIYMISIMTDDTRVSTLFSVQ